MIKSVFVLERSSALVYIYICVLCTHVLNILCVSVLYICVLNYLHRTNVCAGVCLGSYVCIEMSVVLLYRTRPYVYSGYTTHTQKHVSGYRFVAVPDPFSPFDLTGPKGRVSLTGDLGELTIWVSVPF